MMGCVCVCIRKIITLNRRGRKNKIKLNSIEYYQKCIHHF